MSKRDETTERKQLAEFGAVSVVSQRNPEVAPLEIIKWIRERKVLPEPDGEHFTMRFLFWIDNSRNTMTAVKVTMMHFGGTTKLLSAEVESDWQQGRLSKETWSFTYEGVPVR
jgi:hypothetical protein